MENKTFDQLWEDFRIKNPNTVGVFRDQYESFKWLYDRLHMKNKQTAVQWVIEQLRQHAHNPATHLGLGDIRVTQGDLDDLEQLGSQMEREQSEQMCLSVIERILDTLEKDGKVNIKMIFEQYLNQTYEK